MTEDAYRSWKSWTWMFDHEDNNFFKQHDIKVNYSYNFPSFLPLHTPITIFMVEKSQIGVMVIFLVCVIGSDSVTPNSRCIAAKLHLHPPNWKFWLNPWLITLLWKKFHIPGRCKYTPKGVLIPFRRKGYSEKQCETVLLDWSHRRKTRSHRVKMGQWVNWVKIGPSSQV